ncbi:unnamed protein product [Penicillium salamii]|uniref:Uncharacterized protein n=1 Tax=Penicillium salamii TaxID=1612424 RepID=A0A9W4IVP4_9EURO|nr:unnamed protein product [Penicillium salamii]CAG8279442.1 unnamed protein product [Penicillium salamii]CAG8296483.1 unnamed protein product [Penicillium salamii]CAG8347332.1 unnamed protein product [Penicillium salamii]CAG8349319.1 unnamed protein product [Penicillium salamii]
MERTSGSRSLLLGSLWALEAPGVEEFKAILSEEFPNASFEVTYSRKGHSLVATGQLRRHDQDRITDLLERFIDENRSVDVFQVPRVYELVSLPDIVLKGSSPPATMPIPPTKLLESGQPILVEMVQPEKRAPDGSYYENWLPSEHNLYPLTPSSLCLVPTIWIPEGTSVKLISVEGENGFRISGSTEDKVHQSIETLERLHGCLDLIALPPQNLILHVPRHQHEVFRIMPYMTISPTAVFRILSDLPNARSLTSLMRLVVCKLHPDLNICQPLVNIRNPPKVGMKPGVVTSKDWRGIKFPEIVGSTDRYVISDIDKHVARKVDVSPKEEAAKPSNLSADKAQEGETSILDDDPTGRPLGTPSPKTQIILLPMGEAIDTVGKVITPQEDLLLGDQTLGKEPDRVEADASCSLPNVPTMSIPSAGSHISKPQVKPTNRSETVAGSSKPPTQTERSMGPASLTVEEIKEKIRSTWLNTAVTTAKSPSTPIRSGEPKATSLPVSGQLINLDDPDVTTGDEPQSDSKHYPSHELLALRPDVPEDTKANSQDHNAKQRESMLYRMEKREKYWQRSPESYGSTPTRERESSAEPDSPTPSRLQPGWKRAHIRAIIDRSSRSSPTSISGADDHDLITHRSTVIPQSLASPGISRGKEPAENEGEASPSTSLKDHAKGLMQYLQDTIKREHLPEAHLVNLSTPQVVPVVSTQTDLVELLIPDSPDQKSIKASTAAGEKASATDKEQKNVPFLHPDLLDLSFEELVLTGHTDVPQPGGSKLTGGSEPACNERLKSDEETLTRVFRETMFHQSPEGDHLWENLSGGQELTESSRDLYDSIRLILQKVQSFPGTLTLEVGLGLVSVMELSTSQKGKEMTFNDVNELFFSKHGLPPPRTGFFDRLTTSPSDIDYLIALKVDQRPMFEQKAMYAGIRYYFYCHTSSGLDFVIYFDREGNLFSRYAPVPLGNASMSFPAQVWDASASIQGSTHFYLQNEPGLQEAADKMKDSLWVDPKSEQLQMLIRPPPEEIMTIDKVVMERRTSHRWLSKKSKDIFLKVTESQVLEMTPSILDPKVLVIKSIPYEEMIQQCKYWWKASIHNPVIDKALRDTFKPGSQAPGDPTKTWTPTDLLGKDAKLFNSFIELDPLGEKIGHSGIIPMFELAKIVVQNIDAIGYHNRGPASHLKQDPDFWGKGKMKGAPKTELARHTEIVKWKPLDKVASKKHKW